MYTPYARVHRTIYLTHQTFSKIISYPECETEDEESSAIHREKFFEPYKKAFSSIHALANAYQFYLEITDINEDRSVKELRAIGMVFWNLFPVNALFSFYWLYERRKRYFENVAFHKDLVDNYVLECNWGTFATFTPHPRAVSSFSTLCAPLASVRDIRDVLRGHKRAQTAVFEHFGAVLAVVRGS